MKITTNRPAPAFQPVTVSITLESQAEVNALYAVGNWNTQVATTVSEYETENAPYSKTVPSTRPAIAAVLYDFFTALQGFAK